MYIDRDRGRSFFTSHGCWRFVCILKMKEVCQLWNANANDCLASLLPLMMIVDTEASMRMAKIQRIKLGDLVHLAQLNNKRSVGKLAMTLLSIKINIAHSCWWRTQRVFLLDSCCNIFIFYKFCSVRPLQWTRLQKKKSWSEFPIFFVLSKSWCWRYFVCQPSLLDNSNWIYTIYMVCLPKPKVKLAISSILLTFGGGEGDQASWRFMFGRRHDRLSTLHFSSSVSNKRKARLPGQQRPKKSRLFNSIGTDFTTQTLSRMLITAIWIFPSFFFTHSHPSAACAFFNDLHTLFESIGFFSLS